MEKEATVHRLPTEDETPILVNTYINPEKHSQSPILDYESAQDLHSNNTDEQLEERGFKHQHLYVTTDQEIKEGDFAYSSVLKSISTVNKLQAKWYTTDPKWRKIIATTDPKLKIDVSREHKAENCKVVKVLPQPSQDFIKAYCKAGGIDKVMVEYEEWTTMYRGMANYKLKTDSNNCIIIHPVEEKMYSREEMLALCKEAFSHGVRLWEEWEEEDHEMWDKFVKENYKK